VSAPERVLYGLAYWSRRGEPDMVHRLAAALSEPERAEARAVLGLPGVVDTLRDLPEDELRARMLALAGKSRETQVSEPQYEPTTILSGGQGQPTIVIRDHDGWRAQVEAEKRRKAGEEIDAAVKRIERERAVRESAPPRPLVPADPVERVHAEWKRQKWLADCAEARKWTPEFTEAQLATEEVLLSAMRAQEPPAPDPVAERRRRDNEYSHALSGWKSRVTDCGHRSCMPGRCVYE
jgi:hypothetical protein